MQDDDSHGSKDGANKRPLEGVAAEAVELGYKVIEEQIHQGQKFASEIASRMSGSGSTSDKSLPPPFLDKMMAFYTDLGALWFELIESFVANPAFSELMAGRSTANANGAAQTNGYGSSLPLEIQSSRHVDVKMDMDLGKLGPGGAPTVIELRSLDPQATPISEIRFDERNGDWSPILRVRVPDNQPAGTYSGVVIDSSTNEPVGTLCLRVSGDTDT